MNNLIYPYNILNEKIHPLFGNQFTGLPIYVDLSKHNPKVKQICENQTQKEFNTYMFEEIKKHNTNWALSAYLENRETLLSKYPQMVKEQRVYHLGIDITVPVKSKLFAPLDGTVVISEHEEGEGNYGGIVVLKHNINGGIFYSLYGHLDKVSLPKIGQEFKKGEEFAIIGDFDSNGNWFYHTHLQILTEKGYNEGWVHKGYCSEKDLKTIRDYCPDPISLFVINK